MLKYIPHALLLAFLTINISCQMAVESEAPLIVQSPSGDNSVSFFINKEGEAGYTVMHKDQAVIDSSWVSFDFTNMPSIKGDLKVVNTSTDTKNETWPMPWGEQKEVTNHYNSLTVELQETSELQRKFSVIFKVYDDGIGFRYSFPEQENMSEVLIANENTEFQLTGDHTVWWQPGDWDIYEHLYNKSKFSEIDATTKRDHPNLAQTYIPVNAVNTPVTMKTAEGLYLSFHEASLINYSDMTLQVDPATFKMKSNLVGSENTEYKVKQQTPFNTPWRTIQIGERAGDLIESKLIVNLNEPNKLGDVSWFKPMKYVGIWWEMHLDKSTWDMSAQQNMGSFTDNAKPHGKHGATTENAKYYIDFAAKNNIHGILVEGWNTGWEHWIGFEDREGVFDFVTPYPDYDLEEVVRYGKEKGVELIMHHETSAAPRTYEQQMDTAYNLMESLGIHSVKTGYVGKIIPKGEYHHGQWMVNHYQKALETAAKHNIAINAHEPIKATGLRRTYPNFIAREGLRGQEFNAWASDGGNPPNHLPTIAFTRMLGGPIDYTPGIFNIKLDPWKKDNQVNTTLAQQLALYVVIYSPVQMAADLPEYYEAHDDALQFIRDVGVDWDETKVLNGEVGDFVTIARKEKGTDKWFVGSITNEEARELTINLDFLDDGKNYKATIYADGENAHWDDNPTEYVISSEEVNKNSQLQLKLAPGGGAAISILPL
ncbi:glycoside hydrolase family 97 protein [Fulvivirga maritima]|uniref:glycoside hydrolase family 97 protein n=1 Tax=Fulvivirga maritima TaxID=2904247 RepID=UPI001F42C7DC|nr:glycoside hydrolase family 97 protein [Fulvivirga maritima]UII27715.1 glycoside hydrolase family 97 protein [Fulvivirga maritima]